MSALKSNSATHCTLQETGIPVNRPAVFLDRDGTLIEDVGVLHSMEQIKLYPDTIAALRMLHKDYLLFVITNQCAIASGELNEDQVNRLNRNLHEILLNEGIFIQEWYVCPHRREDDCACIKPKPEFVLRAQKKYGLDLEKSFVIGDHPHDVLTANQLGVFGLYLLTGHGSRHLAELEPDMLVFHRISDAAEWIVNHPGHKADLDKQISQCAEVIRNGGVAAFPTETVYGLGADIFQPRAVAQIFKIKGRPYYNPLIAHICDTSQLEDLVAKVPDDALRLIKHCWPGPLTLVLPKLNKVPDIVTGGHNTVAVRMPAHAIALEIIRQCQTPLAAPSANRFTCTSPTTARHVKEQLGDQCKFMIDGGACRVGLESTVISFTGPVPVVLRPGGLPMEEIESWIGKVQTPPVSPANECKPLSPGMMLKHYAPATKLSACSKIPPDFEKQKDIGLLLFKPSERTFSGTVEILSNSGDLMEAATNFFAALRRLDAMRLREIVAEFAPEKGLGVSINNRLAKAAMGRLTPGE